MSSTGSSGESTEISISKSGSSTEVIGKNLGSALAADTAHSCAAWNNGETGSGTPMQPRNAPSLFRVTKTPRRSRSSGEAVSLITFLPCFRNSSRQLRERSRSSDCAVSLSGNIALPLFRYEQLSSLAGFDAIVYFLPEFAEVLDRRG